MDGFRKAHNLIKKKGWVKGSNRGPKGEYCLLSAIEDSLDPGELFYDYVDVLMARLKIRPDSWQDRPGRTKSDVLRLLREMQRV